MANCVNRSLPEFIELQKETGLHPGVLASKIAVWQDKNNTFDFPKLEHLTMNKRLQAGFLKDFNVDVKEYDSIRKALGYNSTQMVDLISKFIAIEKGESLDKASAYIAFKMLGRENNKLAGDLRYRIHAWDKYKEKFQFYKEELFAEMGFVEDSKEWRNRVRDKIIVDYLAETIVKYDQNPTAFERASENRQWTKKDFTFFQKLIRALKNIIIYGFGVNLETRKEAGAQLTNLSTQIAHEVLTQEYDILNYELKDEQIQKYYDQTIEADPFAKGVVEYHQGNGMVLTGSLALRKAGTVFRTAEEALHDLDFVVPFELNDAPVNSQVLKSLLHLRDINLNVSLRKQKQHRDWTAKKAKDLVSQFHWFKNFKAKYPTYKTINAFYGGEHGNYQSFTMTGVIDGQYYEKSGTHEELQKDGTTKKVKHNKGEWIKDTGYVVDHFVRLQPEQEEHENYFKLWKEIMIAKLKMGRAKDLTDFKYFVPFVKSADSFNFFYEDWVYQAGNTAVRGKKELTLKEKIEDSPLGEEVQQMEKSDLFLLQFIDKLKKNLGLTEDDIEQITEEEAKELTIDSINPWRGQAGFYYKGKVYLVKGQINYKTVFHEFAHPLVRAIAADNNKLFNRIYDDIVATPQGKQFLSEALAEYPFLDVNDQMIREEVIVKAMTYVAVNEGSADIESQPSSKLLAAIKKLIYALKQQLRKIFGKSVNPKDLSVNTTVKELADMLVNDTWDINMSTISESDIIAYLGDKEKALKELDEKIDSSRSLIIYESMLEAANMKLVEMEKAEAWSDIIDILAIDEEQTYTSKAKDALRGFSLAQQIKLDQQLKAEQDAALKDLKTDKEKALALKAIEEKENDFFKKRLRALYENLVQVEMEVERINNHLEVLADEPDQQAAFGQLKIYQIHLKASQDMLTEFDKQLAEGGIPAKSGGIRSDVNIIKTNIESATKSVKRIYEAAVSESLSEKFNIGMSGKVQQLKDQQARWRNQIEKTNDSTRKIWLEGRIAEHQDKIEKLLMTPEVMLEYLSGQRGDISFASMMVENFISSQDPSISTFANYIKDTNTKVRTEVHKGRNFLLTEMNKYLKELGVRPDEVVEFSEQFLFKDWKTKRNVDTDEVEEYEVQTFLNPWQNFKRDQGLLKAAENEAYNKWLKNPNEENTQALSDILALSRAHSKFFFKGQFVDEYYHADDALLATTYERKKKDGKTETIKIGELAKQEAKEKYDEVLALQAIEYDSEQEAADNFEKVQAALAEYRKLFSIVDDYGNKKTKEKLAKAEALIANREKKRKYHEFVPIRNAFENALKGQEFIIRAKLAQEKDQFPYESEAYNEELERRLQIWIDNNTRFKVKDEFYTLRNNLYQQLNDIFAKVKEEDLTEEREMLIETLKGRKDDDGQPVGTEMKEELIKSIKDIQELLIRSQEAQPKLKQLGLSQEDVNTIIAIFGALQNLQKTEATTYYIDIVDAYYRRIRKSEGVVNPEEITLENVDEIFSNPTYVATLKGKDAEFDEWFDKNHILRTKKFPEGKRQVYERVKVWSITRPRKEEHIETTKIYDDSGKLVRTIEGLPKMKFYKRQVKSKYVTGYNEETGKIDPYGRYTNQGFQIPKSLEEMKEVRDMYSEELIEHNKKIKEVLGKPIRFDHYINHDYLDLQKQDDARFKLLEVFRNFHHASQIGLDKNKSLGDELPRLRRDPYLYLKSGDAASHAIEKAKMLGKAVGQYMGEREDDPETGLNWKEQMVAPGAEAFSSERVSQIPIRGTYNLPIDQVAPDVVKGIFVYYQSAEQNKALSELQPLAKAMQDMARDPENAMMEFKRVRKKKTEIMSKSAVRTELVPTGKRTKTNNRADLIDGMIEILLEGKGLIEKTNRRPRTVKWVNAAMGIAAHSFFALDMTSALKNFYGAQYQIALEAAGGKYYSYKSWQGGRPWAMKAMRMISNDIYSTGPKSLEVQIIDIFDAVQGRFEEKFGESPSRSVRRDAVGVTWMTSPRKWLETEATLQIFSAIMRDTKVKQIVDGKETEISYIDAWELDENGHIKLKDGIDKKWDMAGEMFNKITNINHETSNFLQGMYAKADKGLLNRFLLWRLFGSLKNYFAKMFMHRFAAKGVTGLSSFLHPEERLNLATGQTHIGFYWGFIDGLVKTIESRGRHILTMTPDERRNLILAPLDFAKQMILGYLLVLLYRSFGTDEDDPKRWSKIMKQTGALPNVPFLPSYTNEKYARKFDTVNWMKAHAILLLMNIEQEATAFSPFSRAGFNHMYDTFVMDNVIAVTGSIEQFKELVQLMGGTILGDDDAYYKKDASAMEMKSKGTPKFISKLYKLGWHPYAPGVPITGKFADPVTSAKNIEGYTKSNHPLVRWTLDKFEDDTENPTSK